jgi:hypothetical protein
LVELGGPGVWAFRGAFSHDRVNTTTDVNAERQTVADEPTVEAEPAADDDS